MHQLLYKMQFPEIEIFLGDLSSARTSLEKAINYSHNAAAEEVSKRFIDSIKELMVYEQCEFALEVVKTASQRLGEEIALSLEPLMHAVEYMLSGDKKRLASLSPEMVTAVNRVVKDVLEEQKKKPDRE